MTPKTTAAASSAAFAEDAAVFFCYPREHRETPSGGKRQRGLGAGFGPHPVEKKGNEVNSETSLTAQSLSRKIT